MGTTTIQLSTDLAKKLRDRKIYGKESYEEVIWDLLEDTKELSDETKKELAESREEIKQGKFKTLGQVKKELGL
jgi:predicted CopG family antitoxin